MRGAVPKPPAVPQPLRDDDPREVAGYPLLARIGEGGMGTVYLSHTRGGQPVALKLIRAEYTRGPQGPAFRERFAARWPRPAASSATTSSPSTTTTRGGTPLARHPLRTGPPARRRPQGPRPAARPRRPAARRLRRARPGRRAHRGRHPPRREAGQHPAGLRRALAPRLRHRPGRGRRHDHHRGPPRGHPPPHVARARAGPHGHPRLRRLHPRPGHRRGRLRPPPLRPGQRPGHRRAHRGHRPRAPGPGATYPNRWRTIAATCLAPRPEDRPTAAETARLCEAEAATPRPLRDFTGWLPAPVAEDVRRIEAAASRPPGAGVPLAEAETVRAVPPTAPLTVRTTSGHAAHAAAP